MNDNDWTAWVSEHAGLFGMTAPGDAELFRLWRQLLAGFSLSELRAASLWLVAEAPHNSRFRTNHVSALRSRITAQRSAAFRRELEQLNLAAESDRCRLCQGVGLVWVPHPGCIVDGLWVYPWYEIVVACTCSRGGARFNGVNGYLAGAQRRVRIGDLTTYEAIHPDWQQIVAARASQREYELAAAHAAGQADKLKPLDPRRLKDALAKIGKPQEARA